MCTTRQNREKRTRGCHTNVGRDGKWTCRPSKPITSRFLIPTPLDLLRGCGAHILADIGGIPNQRFGRASSVERDIGNWKWRFNFCG
eukprot:scaffold5479_cov199-Amphora_coffeaeformis.AAC.13